MPGQQPLPQCEQDKGADRGLQEKAGRTGTININGAVVEQLESFKFLGVHITNDLSWSKHTKTVMKRGRQNLFPLRRLKRFGMDSQKVIQLHHREHYRLVWQLLGIRPQGATEGIAYVPVHHLGQASCHTVPLYWAVSEEGPKNWQ